MSKERWGPKPVGTYENTPIYAPEEVKKDFEIYKSELGGVGWAYLKNNHSPNICPQYEVTSKSITSQQIATILAQIAFGISRAKDLRPSNIQTISEKNLDLISRIKRDLKKK